MTNVAVPRTLCVFSTAILLKFLSVSWFKGCRTPRPLGCGGGGFLDSMRAPAAFAVFCLGATTVGGFGICGVRCRRAPRTRPRHNAILRSTGPGSWRGVWDTFPLRRSSRRCKPPSLKSGKSDDYVSCMQEITTRCTFTPEVKFRSVLFLEGIG